ncbi:zinc-ribbon domain-containing protein [Roseivivax isoporae]|uniref:Zinc finger/thioredoxin putative domain-containing protein n=1 Tax=Roseivivax isoporae LMG 25204 TaxID=1449351 RepID=X7FAP4_9RHOB|nr:zinc-ribbon domain-containing protein [Roseivivax isoporae]ETX29972.1 hypothetical protein RISW2_20195 [Roseivivax isoporae LMG 25204]
MRLICPNCDAQYEVPTAVIPAGGRDVQCSNCGTVWFQAHPDDAPDAADPASGPEEIAADPVAEPVAEEPDAPPPPVADDAPETRPDDDDDRDDASRDDEDEDEGEDTLPAPVGAPGPQRRPAARRSLDPEVAELLRQEAEYEARHRAVDAGGIESQPDLGLDNWHEDDTARRARESRERMAKMRGEPAPADARTRAAAAAAATGAVGLGRDFDTGDTDPAEPPAAQRQPEPDPRPEPSPQPDPAPRPDPDEPASASNAPRRDLLPDIDEINQTLRATDTRRPMETPQGRMSAPEDTDEGGFGRGFLTVLVLGAALIALYAYAPRIAAAVPAAEPPLAAYVEAVDGARTWLDAAVRDLLVRLDALSSEAGES